MCVSSGGILMVKFMLHETGEFAELGNVFAEQIHLMHRPQNRGERCPRWARIARERFAHSAHRSKRKVAIHEGKAGCE